MLHLFVRRGTTAKRYRESPWIGRVLCHNEPVSDARSQVLTSADIAAVTFAVQRFRTGYDVREVDDFLDQCATQLTLPPDRRTLTAEVVSSTRFRTGRRGYPMNDVDAFLDLIAGQLALDAGGLSAGSI